jgi:hypothetical protein
MPSRINVNVPTTGKATTQSQRDNWAIAHQEITDLQVRVDNIVTTPGGGIPEVPASPAGAIWGRITGQWVTLHDNINVDGGEFV